MVVAGGEDVRLVPHPESAKKTARFWHFVQTPTSQRR